MQVGDYAKYRVTGTVGKVLEVQEREGVEWALLDTYQLWYVTSLLDPASANEYKRVAYKERTHRATKEEVTASLEEGIEHDITDVSPSGAG
ncbi:MAG: DUF2098 family protein [Methanomassiliicoccales archaeon]|nr:DUF2098 family protein [Methanomassiliicoccales archaeon]